MALDDRWMGAAACAGHEDADKIFFPVVPKGLRADYRAAKKICAGCDVRVICLEYAIAHRMNQGCWGGLSPHERRAIPAERRLEIRRSWWTHFPTSKIQAVGRR
jgi:WhiB family redox-sensing transcriptional regulator